MSANHPSVAVSAVCALTGPEGGGAAFFRLGEGEREEDLRAMRVLC
eukprot:COSAG01_NODE_4325_length_5131_cov_187.768084_2_plen_46_part_00